MSDDSALSSLHSSAEGGEARSDQQAQSDKQGAAAHGEVLTAEALVAEFADSLEEPAGSYPPDAAARDAARREQAGEIDGTLSDAEFHFVTRGVSDTERAAVIAVLSQVRHEETQRVRRVERREHQPWARSQRVPAGIADLLDP